MHIKNIVVAGGSKGIGLSIVQQLLQEGNKVTVLSRNQNALPFHPNLTFIPIDLTQEDPQAAALPEVIDGLVYAPGSITLKPFKSISIDQYLEDFNINCLGAIRLIKAATVGLKASTQKPGIVLFSTVAVGQGMPFHTSIAMAKGAVEGLIKSLAAEFAPSIRVNGIAPSLTDTDLAAKLLSTPEKIEAAAQRHPLKSVGSPEDIAQMALFLLSERAAWMTGQIIHVDGGMSSVRV